MSSALQIGMEMDIPTFLILERMHCRCEALCTCRWWENWLADHGYTDD